MQKKYGELAINSNLMKFIYAFPLSCCCSTKAKFALRMPNSKTILKFVFVLVIWAFVIIVIMKLLIPVAIVRRYTEAPESEWSLLQEQNLIFDNQEGN